MRLIRPWSSLGTVCLRSSAAVLSFGLVVALATSNLSAGTISSQLLVEFSPDSTPVSGDPPEFSWNNAGGGDGTSFLEAGAGSSSSGDGAIAASGGLRNPNATASLKSISATWGWTDLRTVFHMSCQVGNFNALQLPERWRHNPQCYLRMKPCRNWMYRFAPKF